MRARGAVLVTGGAGFVGSHVVRRLLATRPVYVLDDLSSGDIAHVPSDAIFHLGDVRSEDDVLAALGDDIEAVVHCAAQTSVSRSIAEPEADWATNVAGTRNVVRLARRLGVKRFVFFSSGGAIYGETRFAVADSEMPRPVSYYGLNKYVGEQIVRLEAPSWAILRPSNIYGFGQRTDLEGGVVSIFLERMQQGAAVDVYGDGLQRRDFVYVDDVVDAVELALDRNDEVTWNVSSGRASSVLDLLDALQAITGLKSPICWQPARAGDVRSSQLAPDRLLSTGQWGPPVDLTTGLTRLIAESRASQSLQESALGAVKSA